MFCGKTVSLHTNYYLKHIIPLLKIYVEEIFNHIIISWFTPDSNLDPNPTQKPSLNVKIVLKFYFLTWKQLLTKTIVLKGPLSRWSGAFVHITRSFSTDWVAQLSWGCSLHLNNFLFPHSHCSILYNKCSHNISNGIKKAQIHSQCLEFRKGLNRHIDWRPQQPTSCLLLQKATALFSGKGTILVWKG